MTVEPVGPIPPKRYTADLFCSGFKTAIHFGSGWFGCNCCHAFTAGCWLTPSELTSVIEFLVGTGFTQVGTALTRAHKHDLRRGRSLSYQSLTSTGFAESDMTFVRTGSLCRSALYGPNTLN